MEINFTQHLVVILTGYIKTKAYLHRFKIIKEQTRLCGNAELTNDHVSYECEKLKNI